MKKFFTWMTILLFGASMWSCSYDDDDLWKAVDDLDGRVAAMEAAVKAANSDIAALQKLIEAQQKEIAIKSIEQTADGYTVTFVDDSVIEIANGQDGIDAPTLAVEKDEDGVYYWTLGGEFIEVDGAKLGAQGQEGVSAQLRINPKTKEWEVSADKGTTWTSLGVKAEGTTGQNGDSMFKSVDTKTRPGMVIFTLTSGGKIEIPLLRQE